MPGQGRALVLTLAAAGAATVLALGWLTADVLAGVSSPRAFAAGPAPHLHLHASGVVRSYTPAQQTEGPAFNRGQTLAGMSRVPSTWAAQAEPPAREHGDGGRSVAVETPVPTAPISPVIDRVTDTTRVTVGQTLDRVVPSTQLDHRHVRAVHRAAGHGPPEHAEAPSVNRR